MTNQGLEDLRIGAVRHCIGPSLVDVVEVRLANPSGQVVVMIGGYRAELDAAHERLEGSPATVVETATGPIE